MPRSKFVVGALDDAVKKGDKAALEYYNVPVKHWTSHDWDEIATRYLDVGLHTDPTPGGIQAAQRQADMMTLGRPEGVTKDLRIHVGNELNVEDVGDWDDPVKAAAEIEGQLFSQYPELYEKFQAIKDDVRKSMANSPYFNSSTIPNSLDDNRPERLFAVEQMDKIRNFLRENGVDTLRYANETEGTQDFSRMLDEDPDWMNYEAEQLGKIEEARLAGDDDLALELEDELEYARDDELTKMQEENFSYISLDPGNVRAADAAFKAENIGKPMMRGNADTGLLATIAGLGATGSVLASQSPSESAGQLWEVTKSLGQGILDDAQSGARKLQRGLTGKDIGDFGSIDLGAEETPLGNAMASDFGNWLTGIDMNPFPGEYTIGQGINDAVSGYNEYVKPYLTPGQEDVLGGATLLGSMIGANPMSRTTRVGTEATRLGKQTAAKNKEMWLDPAAALREEMSAAGGFETVVENVPDHRNLPILRADDLQGAAIMPVQGDRTMIGDMTKVQGIDIDPLHLQGGPLYPLANPDAWESTRSIANSFQDKVRKVAEDAGTDKILGIYSPMKLDAANFSTMPAEVAMRQLQEMKNAGAQWNPAMVRRLDEVVRNSGGDKNPNAGFPGLLSTEAEAFLSQRGPAAVAARKALLNEMKKAPYRDAGFPLVEQIYRDVSVPEMLGHDVGQSGDIILSLDPRGQTHGMSNHRTYDTAIPGGIKGRLADSTDFGNIYRDPMSDLEGVMTESKWNEGKQEWTNPRLLNSLEKINTTVWNKPGTGGKTKGYQMVDDQLIEQLVQMGLLRP